MSKYEVKINPANWINTELVANIDERAVKGLTYYHFDIVDGCSGCVRVYNGNEAPLPVDLCACASKAVIIDVEGDEVACGYSYDDLNDGSDEFIIYVSGMTFVGKSPLELALRVVANVY